ncbi:MAG TPA: lysophospholipid acyltransferase family protein [Vicinamibacterales bacterium]|nr:lysophospholipid acyltransferase family protein [Vicinamibacterales bacterium]
MSLVALRYRLEYALVLAVRGLVRRLPDAAARGLGSLVGLCFYAIDPAHRRLAVRQLRAAFPTRSAAECRAIARRTFAHFGRLLVVLLKFSTLTPDQIRARVEFEGDERVRAALDKGHGAILFSGHFGYWELQGLAQPLVLPSISVLARPLDNPYLHALLEEMRLATGNRVIYRQGALRRVLRALNANECVAILIDQHIQGSDAVRVEFFNRPAATTAALATFALRTGAPLIPAFALPLAGGRYRLIYEHPIELPSAGSADPVRDLTQRCTDVLEMYVRRYPELWLWMHRRWRDEGDEAKAVPGMFPAAAPDRNEEPVE